MRLWVIVGILVGATVFAVAAYFLPERETVITRDVVAEDIRRTMTVIGPLVNDLKE